MSGDAGSDTRWMSYAELAIARGIDRPSAERLVLRRKWRRQKGNNGKVRIAVPLSYLATSPDKSPDTSPDMSTDISPDVSADISSAIKVLEEALRRADERADRAEARAEADRTRADALRDRLEELRAELEVARQAAAVDQAKIATLTAEATLDALRAERAAWSTWRRLRWAITGR